MSKDSIKLIKYFGLIFIAVLISYELPHDSYSLIQYIIKPIKFNHGEIYLSGIIPFIIICIGIKGIWGLERFEKKNKIWIALLIFVLVIPFMKWTIDFARVNYHSLRNDGLNAIEIQESNIRLGSTDDSTKINITLKLKNYSRRHNEFKIRVYLPKSLSEYTGKEYYELENYYVMRGNNTLNVNEQIVVKTKHTDEYDDFLNSNWFYEEVKYELYDDKESVYNIEHEN